MEATQSLKADHDEVRALFQQFRGGGGITGLVKRVTGNVSARERRTAVEKVCHELEVHARIEEEIFYPAVRALGNADLDEQLNEAFEEHARVKEQVASLRTTRGSDEEIDAKMKTLEECVEHHATEEENEMFPRVQDLMPEERRIELGRQLQAAKRGLASRTRRPARAASSNRRTKAARRAVARGRAARTKPVPRRPKATKRTKKASRRRAS